MVIKPSHGSSWLKKVARLICQLASWLKHEIFELIAGPL